MAQVGVDPLERPRRPGPIGIRPEQVPAEEDPDADLPRLRPPPCSGRYRAPASTREGSRRSPPSSWRTLPSGPARTRPSRRPARCCGPGSEVARNPRGRPSRARAARLASAPMFRTPCSWCVSPIAHREDTAARRRPTRRPRGSMSVRASPLSARSVSQSAARTSASTASHPSTWSRTKARSTPSRSMTPSTTP